PIGGMAYAEIIDSIGISSCRGSCLGVRGQTHAHYGSEVVLDTAGTRSSDSGVSRPERERGRDSESPTSAGDEEGRPQVSSGRGSHRLGHCTEGWQVRCSDGGCCERRRDQPTSLIRSLETGAAAGRVQGVQRGTIGGTEEVPLSFEGSKRHRELPG